MADEDLELVTHMLGTQIVHLGTRERRFVIAGQIGDFHTREG
jgi:hypothetical protein